MGGKELWSLLLFHSGSDASKLSLKRSLLGGVSSHGTVLTYECKDVSLGFVSSWGDGMSSVPTMPCTVRPQTMLSK